VRNSRYSNMLTKGDWLPDAASGKGVLVTMLVLEFT
jgi:hypothetical protein